MTADDPRPAGECTIHPGYLLIDGKCTHPSSRYRRPAASAPAAAPEPSSNQQRAARVLDNVGLVPRMPSCDDLVAAALDAAEARGRAEVAAKVEVLNQGQADALLDRLHAVRRAEGRLPKFDSIRQLAEAIYVLAGWCPPDELSVPDARITAHIAAPAPADQAGDAR